MQYKKAYLQKKKKLKKFLESRQDTGPKADTRRRQNEQQDKADKTRQQIERRNQIAALKFQTGGETSEEPGLPLGM